MCRLRAYSWIGLQTLNPKSYTLKPEPWAGFRVLGLTIEGLRLGQNVHFGLRLEGGV